MTAKEAKEQKIFVLNYDNANYKDADSLENRISVEETNYYDFVSLSIDETTSSRGVAPRTFIEEREDIILKVKSSYSSKSIEMLEGRVGKNDWRFESFLKWLDVSLLDKHFDKYTEEESLNFGYEIVDEENETTFTYYSGTIYEIMNWGVRGNNLRSEEEYFISIEDAEDYLFKYTENRFYNDDQRITAYFSSYDDAQDDVIETLSEWWGVSNDTAKSIIKRQKLVDKIKDERLQVAFLKQKEENERVEAIAEIYANMIDKIDNELFEDTIKRLANAIGQRIEKKVFYKAVKLVRAK